MKGFIKRHVPWWPQLLTILIAVGGIEGMRTGFGLIGRTVDIVRLPDVVAQVDAKSKERDDRIMGVVQANSAALDNLSRGIAVFRNDTGTNLLQIRRRQDKVINFIDGLTNHPPIEWPGITAKSKLAEQDRYERTDPD